MLTLTGTLRQSADLDFTDKNTGKPKPMRKLWVEHESARENGPADLQILELLVPAETCPELPPKGAEISVDVRAYAVGRNVAFSALGVRSGASTLGSPLKAAGGHSAAK